HVARADLEHAHLLRHPLHFFLGQNLRNNRQAEGSSRLDQKAQALLPQALEAVGGGAGLKGSAPEDMGAALNEPGDLHDLPLILHRAGSGDVGAVPSTNPHFPHGDYCILWLVLPADQMHPFHGEASFSSSILPKGCLSVNAAKGAAPQGNTWRSDPLLVSCFPPIESA